MQVLAYLCLLDPVLVEWWMLLSRFGWCCVEAGVSMKFASRYSKTLYSNSKRRLNVKEKYIDTVKQWLGKGIVYTIVIQTFVFKSRFFTKS